MTCDIRLLDNGCVVFFFFLISHSLEFVLWSIILWLKILIGVGYLVNIYWILDVQFWEADVVCSSYEPPLVSDSYH